MSSRWNGFLQAIGLDQSQAITTDEHRIPSYHGTWQPKQPPDGDIILLSRKPQDTLPAFDNPAWQEYILQSIPESADVYDRIELIASISSKPFDVEFHQTAEPGSNRYWTRKIGTGKCSVSAENTITTWVYELVREAETSTPRIRDYDGYSAIHEKLQNMQDLREEQEGVFMIDNFNSRTEGSLFPSKENQHWFGQTAHQLPAEAHERKHQSFAYSVDGQGYDERFYQVTVPLGEDGDRQVFQITGDQKTKMTLNFSDCQWLD
ncbi:uncharacterized protein I303_105455 [Kwoniella dejecticola CBS 10117]|uniref:Uncharacterized protein n=1 Tax=Kwoniella dejecticola CBS 10117 TaxID=1296121 RepID=A0A1A6A2F7_9TREE|nr:uncharacterized protein I303_05104 [Kwoniella dejecticola CBS 10117]OBR84247.1 hypothetical protein I303_05104 [Kwoniella dejecticola CBS 10117]